MCMPTLENKKNKTAAAASPTLMGDALKPWLRGGIGSVRHGVYQPKPTGMASFVGTGLKPKAVEAPKPPPGEAPIEGKETDFRPRGARSLLSSFASRVQAKASFGE